MALSSQGLHDRVDLFWAHHRPLAALLEQLRRPLRGRQLGLQLPDPPAGLTQPSGLRGPHSTDQAPVDAVLTLPAMQRRLMHLQLPRQPGHRSTVAHLLHDHRTKLR